MIAQEVEMTAAEAAKAVEERRTKKQSEDGQVDCRG